MMRFVLPTVLTLASAFAWATPLTPDNILGRYKVDASYMFQHAYMKIHVLNNQEFDITRYYPNGKEDPTCQGTYSFGENVYLDEAGFLAGGKIFKGVFTCPDDRSKQYDFNIDYKNTQLEDLIKGATVSVTSSLAPGVNLKAHVIRY
ncbi:MAG: hypothetical protein ACM3MG_08615 [Bacillota bacterium]